MMRYLARPIASRTANRALLIAATITVLVTLEIHLARLLDDHIAATILALTAAVVSVAMAAPVFAKGRR